MKALIYKDTDTLKTEEREIPCKKSEVLVKVKYAGICGSDLSIVSGKHPRAVAPLVPGHEFSGVVERIDSNANGFVMGDRVVINPLVSCGLCRACRSGNEHVCNTLRLIGIDWDGGMGEYASVPMESLVKIPDELEDDVSALVEPLAVAIHGIRESRLSFLDNVLIIGAGPIGLLTGIVLKDSGASDIYITEVDDFRLSVCKELGLKAIDAKTTDISSFIKKNTGGEGADIVFEASGNAIAARQMTDFVRVKGTVLILSVHKDPHEVDLRALNFKELTFTGSRVYSKLDFEKAVNYAVEIKDALKRIISHRVPLSEGSKAFEFANDKNSNALKVLIDCSN